MKQWLFIFFLISFSIHSQTIDWLDFNTAVFEKAKEQHKPVILDLGATWCHWCHVMDDSTYSDPAVIDYLSQHFICAKANQDKRPDLHSKYKDYGWPATVIFNENAGELLKYAGYADPREFLAMLKQIIETPGKIAVTGISKVSVSGKWSDSTKRFIERDFYSFLDLKKGGFDMNQKFIEYDSFEYALLHAKEDKRLNDWLSITIRNSGYINDPVWGGVYQYSTHGDWHYAHFEKLLSIQARYLKIYARYYAAYKDPLALQRANGIVRYLGRFLKSNSALYYNSQDADLKEGEHAAEFFALANEQRLKKGIPRIDSTCYLKENAQLAEAFIYLWAATGEKKYLQQSGMILKELKNGYKIPGLGYVHDKKISDAIALGDYEYFCRALMCYYNATGEEWSRQEAMATGKEMITDFKSDEGFLNYRSASNPLPPNSMLTENIDLCRIFNRLYYITGEESFRAASRQIFSYLISEKILKEIIAESGILTVKEELDKEPVKVVIFLKSDQEAEWEKTLEALWRQRSGYFVIERIIGDAVPEKYKDMKDAAGNNNCAFICSSSSCSSPFFSSTDLKIFLAKKPAGKRS